MAIPEILIVGGTGQVGSELISLLTQASISVRVLTRPASSRKIAENSNGVVRILEPLTVVDESIPKLLFTDQAPLLVN